MHFVYYFNLKDVINIDNFYDFLEIYLKENRILKKDFFKKTGISANSYRFFLKNKEKNKYYYYEIISREYNLFIPDDEILEQLSRSFSKIIEDILYMRIEKKEEDMLLIEQNLTLMNENVNNVSSMAGLAFKALKFYLDISFTPYSIPTVAGLFKNFYKIAKPYKDLFVGEYRLFLLIIKMYGDSILNHTINKAEIEEATALSVRYLFVQPLLNKIISDAYYYCGDYMNATIYGMKSYNGFVEVSNFQRAIYVKINMAYSLILLGSYYNAYDVLFSLYLAYDSYNTKYKRSILRGIIECLILLDKYCEAYDFIIENKDVITQDEWKIEYLIILYKLNKKEEYNLLFDDIKKQYKNKDFYELYYQLVLEINNLCNGVRVSKQTDAILSKLHNLTFIKICKKIFS
ncbi:MAG: hypothetical protein E7176_01415 [Erysipelotrichaceae bacterium]|nr:hypothetical protein [Erysipelotrichaceae bacterium]